MFSIDKDTYSGFVKASTLPIDKNTQRKPLEASSINSQIDIAEQLQQVQDLIKGANVQNVNININFNYSK